MMALTGSPVNRVADWPLPIAVDAGNLAAVLQLASQLGVGLRLSFRPEAVFRCCSVRVGQLTPRAWPVQGPSVRPDNWSVS